MTFCKPGMHDGQQTPGSAVVLARGWAHVAFDWLIREVADYTTIYNPNGGLVKAGLLPIVTGSNSGGSMFATRYFALRTTPSATKWSYPCYLLAEPYRTVCYYHAGFGDISQECESETMNVLNLATATVYGGIMTAYGGPLGTASVFLYVYFPFLSGLPVRSKNLQWSEFVKKNVMFSTSFGLPSNWVAARSDPKDASFIQPNSSPVFSLCSLRLIWPGCMLSVQVSSTFLKVGMYTISRGCQSTY